MLAKMQLYDQKLIRSHLFVKDVNQIFRLPVFLLKYIVRRASGYLALRNFTIFLRLVSGRFDFT